MIEFLKSAAQYGTRNDKLSLSPNELSFLVIAKTIEEPNELRNRIETVLDGTGFDLFPATDEDPDLFVLIFRGLKIEQPADFLFAVGHDLADAIGGVVVEPEIEPLYADILSVRGSIERESLGDTIWALCSSQANELGNSHWAPEMIRAREACSKFSVSGNQIKVAQPDTGVAAHRELDDAVDTSLGYNFVEASDDPTDPLSKHMSSPGHGTGTASVVASREDRIVVGSAPGATLVPYRAINSVVIGSGFAVARSIDHARRSGCHIVTMSLGGPFGGHSLRRAIRRAVEANMIVLAAAGNCVRFVTYPARDSNVIAVAGIDENGSRWRGSCRGSDVDISAPGENVYVAKRRDDGSDDAAALSEVNSRGQGTSFAVALTAGTAALWLEYFGVNAVATEAQRRNVSVQELFRAALRQSAHVPAGWPSSTMGAGIVDAVQLLSLPLDQIAVDSVPHRVESPSFLAFGRDFEGALGAEADTIGMDWLLRQKAGYGAELERAMPLQPSKQLEALLEHSSTTFPNPDIVTDPASLPVSGDLALQRLTQVNLAQATNNRMEFSQAIEAIGAADKDAMLSSAQERFEAMAAAEPDKVNRDLQRQALERMEHVLADIARETPSLSLTSEQRAAFEALVRLRGRPVIALPEDEEEPSWASLESWAETLMPIRHDWLTLSRQVGRIDVFFNGNWQHAGTGFVFADGQIMTNRHVIDAFAVSLPAASGQQNFHIRFPASINFAPSGHGNEMRFAIKSIITAGSHRIGRRVNMDYLDMAILEVERHNGQSVLPRVREDYSGWQTVNDSEKILVVGYPAEPLESHAPTGAGDPDSLQQFWSRIDELYGQQYGRKYASPGLITDYPGKVSDDPRGWAFAHDATSLHGSSGSAVISLSPKRQFCGLHFGGKTLSRNLAHDVSIVKRIGDGTFVKSVL